MFQSFLILFKEIIPFNINMIASLSHLPGALNRCPPK